MDRTTGRGDRVRSKSDNESEIRKRHNYSRRNKPDQIMERVRETSEKAGLGLHECCKVEVSDYFGYWRGVNE